jgi:hypothetical protein
MEGVHGVVARLPTVGVTRPRLEPVASVASGVRARWDLSYARRPCDGSNRTDHRYWRRHQLSGHAAMCSNHHGKRSVRPARDLWIAAIADTLCDSRQRAFGSLHNPRDMYGHCKRAGLVEHYKSSKDNRIRTAACFNRDVPTDSGYWVRRQPRLWSDRAIAIKRWAAFDANQCGDILVRWADHVDVADSSNGHVPVSSTHGNQRRQCPGSTIYNRASRPISLGC